MLKISRIQNKDLESLTNILANDECVTEAVSDLLAHLRVKVSPCIAEHSMATALLAASIARVMGVSTEEIFMAGVVGALHEVGSLIVLPPTEAESLRMAESKFMLEKARFRLATIDLLTGIPALVEYAPLVAELYTDTQTSQVARIVAVADWYDWFCSADEGQRPASSLNDALTYLERNVGVRFQKEVVAALRDLSAGYYRDVEFA